MLHFLDADFCLLLAAEEEEEEAGQGPRWLRRVAQAAHTGMSLQVPDEVHVPGRRSPLVLLSYRRFLISFHITPLIDRPMCLL
jgi:hypothetical protein